jgi:four helix bundle protein
MLKLSHKTLKVYQIALKLVNEVYVVTRQFPKEEQYVIVVQLRRAAISVCSNIAEGSARISKNEKKRFYEIARSSAVEIDTQMEIATNLNYLHNVNLQTFENHLESVFRILCKIIQNLDK